MKEGVRNFFGKVSNLLVKVRIAVPLIHGFGATGDIWAPLVTNFLDGGLT
jgi:hypothetical protein